MATSRNHDDVIKWKHFPRYWPIMRGIHRSPVNSHRKDQWRRALVFSLICAWITVEQTIVRLVIWDAIAPILTSSHNAINFHGQICCLALDQIIVSRHNYCVYIRSCNFLHLQKKKIYAYAIDVISLWMYHLSDLGFSRPTAYWYIFTLLFPLLWHNSIAIE